MRVLVTGTSGYAGGVIARALREQGYTVLAAGRRLDDDVRLDLHDPQAIAALDLPPGVEACVHAAAMHEVGCARHPELAYLANVAATRALVHAAARAGVRHLVYISTFHVFGNPSGRLDEQAAPIPANDYGLTHLQAEQVVRMAGAQHGMAVDVLRPANLFGAPTSWSTFDRWTLAPFDFCAQAFTVGRIKLHGRGLAVRNYHSVGHLAAATVAALLSAGHGVTHLAGWNWSILDLARLAAQVASECLAASVPVVCGDGADVAGPAYEYASVRVPGEQGQRNAAMRRFLEETIMHLQGSSR